MKKYILIIISAFFVGVTTNIAHPITPYYINEIGLSTSLFAYFFFAMSLGMLFSSPFLGSLGDQSGRKKIIVICLFGYAFSQTLFGTFRTVPLIIGARFLSGLFSGGILTSLLSYLGGSKDLRKFSYLRLSATFISIHTVGVAIGSYLGGLLGSMVFGKYEYVLYIQSLLVVLFALYVLFFIKMGDEEHLSIRSKNPFQSFTYLKKIHFKWIVFLIIILLINIAFTDTQKYLDVYFSDAGFPSNVLGTVNLIVGLVTLVANILLTPILIKYLKSIGSIIVSGIIAGVMIICTFRCSNLLTGIYSYYMVYIIFKAIIDASIINYINNFDDMPKGIIMGLRQSFISLGGLVGVLVGGLIYAKNPILLFFLCAAILFLVSIIALFLLKKGKKHEKV